ncbi:hypothetical protein Busp01_32770 [Trinickia caryophylli]|uniref:MerR family regulatory protein n=1 Tax=Trinickia caryophylli TaxID=28094 RepID=A0A1X7G4Z3_TRICW|nr:hypothetical protein Busp01_32770 [Trinickia caryophylli]SMF63387.1 MerR family regulatory protein [Trinickia caryophylli]
MRLKIGELARKAGLSVRVLHRYDAIGLLLPSQRTDGGAPPFSSRPFDRHGHLASPPLENKASRAGGDDGHARYFICTGAWSLISSTTQSMNTLSFALTWRFGGYAM